MFRFLVVAVLALFAAPADALIVQPGLIRAPHSAPACVMAAKLRTNDVVKVISGADKVSSCTIECGAFAVSGRMACLWGRRARFSWFGLAAEKAP